MTQQPDLSGRNLLVMGAAGEAAQAIAVAFAQAGADIALTTTTSDAEEAFSLRRVSRQVTALGRRCVSESVDMSIGTNVQVAVRQVAKQLGGIDVLLLAPDFQPERAAERLSDAEWAKVISLNLSAVFYACRSVGREMTNRPTASAAKGRIVVLLPVVAEDANPAYAAARAGARELVLSLSREWVERPLTLNVVSLAAVEDAVAAALMLASDEGESISGRVIEATS